MVFGSKEAQKQITENKTYDILETFEDGLTNTFELTYSLPDDKDSQIDHDDLTEILFDVIEHFFGTVYTDEFWESLILKMSNDEDVYELMKKRLAEIEKDLSE